MIYQLFTLVLQTKVYKVGQKSNTPLAFEFPFLLDALFALFVYSHIIFIKLRRSLSADVNTFFMRINCNFATMVGLTNDERYLIHNLRAEKHCGSEKL